MYVCRYIYIYIYICNNFPVSYRNGGHRMNSRLVTDIVSVVKCSIFIISRRRLLYKHSSEFVGFRKIENVKVDCANRLAGNYR